MPRPLRNFLADTVGNVWFYVLRFRRDIVLDNLRLAFPDLEEHERVALAAANFRFYGHNLVELLVSFSWSPERLRREPRVVHRLEIPRAVAAAGRGGVILLNHTGNWEATLATLGMELQVEAVVKRTKSPAMTKLLFANREKSKCRILIETGTAMDVLRSLSKGRLVTFTVDQFMGPPIGLPVTFFGHEAGTAAGLALMTDKRDVPVIPVYGFRDEHGVNHVVFEEPLDMSGLSSERNQRLFEKTQMFNDTIERQIRQRPEQWLWLHRRWKPYRGVPRWLPERMKGLTTSTATAFLAALLLGACASMGTSQTGIEIPPDPEIAVPEVKQVADKEGDQVFVKAVTPTPTPVPTPEPKTKKKKAAAPKPTQEAALLSMVEVANIDRIPFEVGEQMQIDLSWNSFLTAGRATLEVREGPQFYGRPTFHLWANLVSSKLVNMIYKLDNTLESFVDVAGLMPYKFLLHMVESKQNKETRVSFDHVKGKAHYWAKRISPQWGNENHDRVDKIPPLARDMYSAIYYARTLDYSLGKKVSFPIYENAQNLTVELLPVANELVRTKAGIFQCWKLHLTLMVNNVLRPTGDIFMWLSEDSKRYLVKFDAKIKVGSVVGTLVSLKERKQ